MAEPAEVEILNPRLNGHRSSWQAGNTYGALQPIDISALDALVDDIHRTQAHILWLEHYIANYITADDIFTEMVTDVAREQERTRVGKPSSSINNPAQPGTVRWQLEVARKRQTATQGTRRRTHPAIHELQSERRHMADIATKAVALGIKLDMVEYSRQQADMIVEAMGRFALKQGLSPTDPAIQAAITEALEFVLNQRNGNTNQNTNTHASQGQT